MEGRRPQGHLNREEFVAYSDESYDGKNPQSGVFIVSGFVAEKRFWNEEFIPAWRASILDPTPTIPYLHMTEIREDGFRKKYRLSKAQAEGKIDVAVSLLRRMGQAGDLFRVSSQVGCKVFREAFQGIDIASEEAKQYRHPRPYEPDFHCYQMFACYASYWLQRAVPSTKTVAFVFEKSTSDMAFHLQELQRGLGRSMNDLQPGLASLIGGVRPGTRKDDHPLQAADVLSWHMRLMATGQSSPKAKDKKRHRALLDIYGHAQVWPNSEVRDFADRTRKAFRPKE